VSVCKCTYLLPTTSYLLLPFVNSYAIAKNGLGRCQRVRKGDIMCFF